MTDQEYSDVIVLWIEFAHELGLIAEDFARARLANSDLFRCVADRSSAISPRDRLRSAR